MLRSERSRPRQPRSRPLPCTEGDDHGSRRAAMASVPCRFFRNGGCARGDNCWFKHDTAYITTTTATESPRSSIIGSNLDVDSSLATEMHVQSQTSKTPACPTSSTQSDLHASTSTAVSQDTKDELQCIICFEKPTRFGLLEACAHVYCLTCIRDWRTQKGKTAEQIEAGVLMRCPACRATSNFVVPADTFLPTGEGKLKYIDGYKARLGNIPCRHFQESSPLRRYCPFGKDCFYAHKDSNGATHVFTHNMTDHLNQYRRQREQRELQRSLRNFYNLWQSGDLDDGPLMHPAYRHPDLDHDHDDYDDDDSLLNEYELEYEEEDYYPWGPMSYFDNHELRERMGYELDDHVDDENDDDDQGWGRTDDEGQTDSEDEERFQMDLVQALRASLVQAEPTTQAPSASTSAPTGQTRPVPVRDQTRRQQPARTARARMGHAHPQQPRWSRNSDRQAAATPSDRLISRHQDQIRQTQPVIEQAAFPSQHRLSQQQPTSRSSVTHAEFASDLASQQRNLVSNYARGQTAFSANHGSQPFRFSDEPTLRDSQPRASAERAPRASNMHQVRDPNDRIGPIFTTDESGNMNVRLSPQTTSVPTNETEPQSRATSASTQTATPSGRRSRYSRRRRNMH